MSLNVDLSASGAWELMYYQKLSADPRTRSKPYLDPVELPFLTESRIFIVSTFSLKGKPTWYRAGYLSRQIEGINIDDTVVFEGLGRVPTTTADYGHVMIPYNLSKVVIFPFIGGNHSLRFEAMPWIYDLNLGIWAYTGVESDSTEDLIEAMQAKLETIEFKIEQL